MRRHYGRAICLRSLGPVGEKAPTVQEHNMKRMRPITLLPRESCITFGPRRWAPRRTRKCSRSRNWVRVVALPVRKQEHAAHRPNGPPWLKQPRLHEGA